MNQETASMVGKWYRALQLFKKIVEDHKGKIWAESVEGEGTTMHLNLLKAKDEENPENA